MTKIVLALALLGALVAAPAVLVTPAKAGFTCTTSYSPYTRTTTTRCY